MIRDNRQFKETNRRKLKVGLLGKLECAIGEIARDKNAPKICCKCQKYSTPQSAAQYNIYLLCDQLNKRNHMLHKKTYQEQICLLDFISEIDQKLRQLQYLVQKNPELKSYQ